MVKIFVDQFIQFGEIKCGLLGIKGMEMSVDIVKVMNFNVQCGVFVSEVLLNFGFVKVGIKFGDVIVSLNGKLLNSFVELCLWIVIIELGIKVKLGLLCDGKLVDVEVILDKSIFLIVSVELIILVLQGVLFSDGQMKDGIKGVVIGNVDKGSVVVQVGLYKDDIIIGFNWQCIYLIVELCKVFEGKLLVIVLNVICGNESIYLLLC